MKAKRMLGALAALTIAGAVPAFAQDTTPSTSGMANDQMAMNSAMPANDMSPSQMAAMKKCQAMSHDMMMKNKKCAAMAKTHPDMMSGGSTM